MFRLFLLAALVAPVFAATSAADLARAIAQNGIDPGECYRVTELNFSKEDLRIYLTSGYLAFAKPVNGIRMGAVFTTDIEAGDAEVLLIPPTRGERMSLANFTRSPNLDEHLKAALMVFTDSTGAELEKTLRSRNARKNAEMGALLADQWTPVFRNLSESFSVRLVHDLISPNPKNGIFYMGIAGANLGNFDAIYDFTVRDQITLGQLAYRNDRPFFNVWTSFPARAARDKASTAAGRDPYSLDDFRIDTTIQPDLSLDAIARASLTTHDAGRVFAFSLSRRLKITEVRVDGNAAEVFERESLRSSLISGPEDEQFLVILPGSLEPGKPHEVEFRYHGEVISKAGPHVYFVGSRGSWYPRAGIEWARYDLTFRCPKDVVLVATGEVIEDRIDGEWRVVHRRASAPIRYAGFNLGDYECLSRDIDAYNIGVCANRELEAALKPRSQPLILPPPATESRRRPFQRQEIPADLPAPPPPNPTARLGELAQDVSGALQYMAAHFGPPPLHNLTISPIPGGFGQGFPGLIYLSTLAYLDPAQLPRGMRDPVLRTFYTDVLDAHEVAHQWWGNLVASAGYEDEWLMEALADYSALMFLEKKKGVRALDAVLERYKSHLLMKSEDGRTIESQGPITWGVRLFSSHSPEAWHTITYEKGAWIVHMLRRRMGDERFTSFLREFCKEYRFRPATAEQFREVGRQFVPPKSPDPDLKMFFDNWVYGTGIPSVKFSYSVRNGRITGTLTASDVEEDFTALVPVEIQRGRTKTVQWFPVSTEPARFSAVGVKASLAVNDSLIRK